MEWDGVGMSTEVPAVHLQSTPDLRLNLVAKTALIPHFPMQLFGRNATLAQITATLAEGSKALIVGPSGMGKSSIATTYASLNADSYAYVLWLSCVDAQAADQSIEMAVETLGIMPSFVDGPQADRERVRKALFDWLGATPGYLLVIDNADDQRVLEELFGAARKFAGHVVITSRDNTVGEWFGATRSIELEPWSRTVTESYLFARKPEWKDIVSNDTDERKALDTLLDLLDGYPLAVEQVASYAIEKRIGGLKYYLPQFRNASLAYVSKASKYRSSLAGAFHLNVAQLQREGEVGRAAINILGVASCFAPENIPKSLLAVSIDASRAPDLLDSALSSLQSSSLIRLQPKTVSIHSLYQLLANQFLEPYGGSVFDGEISGFWVRRAVHALDKYVRGMGKESVEDSSIRRMLVKHVVTAVALLRRTSEKTAFKPASDVAYSLCKDMYTQSNFESAEQLCEMALELQTIRLGSRNHAEVALTVEYLGRISMMKGQNDVAKTYLIAALKTQRIVYGKRNHPDVASPLRFLARIAAGEGDMDAAETYIKEALEIDLTMKDYKLIAVDYLTLGDIARLRGNLQSAENYLREFVEALPAKLPKPHNPCDSPNVQCGMASSNSISIFDLFVKRPLSFSQKLYLLTTTYGTPYHPIVHHYLLSYGVVARSRGDLQAAKEFLTKCREIEVELYPTRSHLKSARTVGELGLVSEQEGDWAAAKAYLVEAREILRVHFGADHPEVSQVDRTLNRIRRKERFWDGTYAVLGFLFGWWKDGRASNGQ
ncbi:hypothetical protein HDV00_003444 [Rhizophlyctis rosea]|nr:hypothetical protein HDV00_003444 [Rhizophlyctis rosea]